MAYAATVTVNHAPSVNGMQCFSVLIEETDAAASSEATIEGIPSYGRVVRQVCHHSSGTGSTVDPILGISTNPAGADVVVENDTAGGTVDNYVDGASYYASGATLYHRSNVNSGTDNVVTTRYLIVAGWE